MANWGLKNISLRDVVSDRWQSCLLLSEYKMELHKQICEFTAANQVNKDDFKRFQKVLLVCFNEKK